MKKKVEKEYKKALNSLYHQHLMFMRQYNYSPETILGKITREMALSTNAYNLSSAGITFGRLDERMDAIFGEQSPQKKAIALQELDKWVALREDPKNEIPSRLDISKKEYEEALEALKKEIFNTGKHNIEAQTITPPKSRLDSIKSFEQ